MSRNMVMLERPGASKGQRDFWAIPRDTYILLLVAIAFLALVLFQPNSLVEPPWMLHPLDSSPHVSK